VNLTSMAFDSSILGFVFVIAVVMLAFLQLYLGLTMD
jgi:hypothetical protein